MSAHQTCDVIVIGAGAGGLSTAYQLAARGQNVVVLERRALASGSTQMAAGLLGQWRSQPEATRMLQDSIQLLLEMQREYGRELFYQTGSVRLAETPERVDELRYHVNCAEQAGLEVERLDANRLASLVPYIAQDDVLEAYFCPSDGYLEPPELAEMYIALARRAGVDFYEDCPAKELLLSNDKVQGVATERGNFFAPVIVNASGAWAHLVAQLARTPLATAAVGHYYVTLKPHPEVPVSPDHAALRDRHLRLYARPCQGGLRFGMYEAEPRLYDMKQLPANADIANLPVEPDHPAIVRLLDVARQRFPFLRNELPLTAATGIMTFTPDNHTLLGQIPGVGGLYHCAGLCGHGIAQSPILGKILADLILSGECDYDLESLRADRFADWDGVTSREQIEAACFQTYADNYGKADLPGNGA